jgi:REP element-mobilizing transposase RayT
MKSAHSNLELRYHFTFVTKCRKKSSLLNRSEIEFIRGNFNYACERINCKLLAINADDENHIHAIIETHQNLNIAQIACAIKTQTSKTFNTQGRAIKLETFENPWPGWRTGYSAQAIGAEIANIYEYIENQGKAKK